MDTLKKAGLMTQHLDLFHHMQDLRSLLQLAAHMEERGDRAALIGQEGLTLIGTDTVSDASITTSKGATITAPVAYRLMAQLKGFDDEEYTVNRKELAALNARAVAELESSDALRAFADTLARISAAPQTPAQPTQSAEPAQAERPARGRRGAEEQNGEQPAA
ncbi:multidrug DMT transporter [Deinococcus fonticola]|uniref:multidrug DMT transporter n=1 Tax=Deinococcus fonticola TaxID=2528713 RepID=UPI001074E09D|nr:multidrug DMT transporter [Deinococcus fonticola]